MLGDTLPQDLVKVRRTNRLKKPSQEFNMSVKYNSCVGLRSPSITPSWKWGQPTGQDSSAGDPVSTPCTWITWAGTRPTFIPICCQGQSWTTEPQHWLIPLTPAPSAIWLLWAKGGGNISPLALPWCWSFLLTGRGRRQRWLEPKPSPGGTKLNAGHMLVVLALWPLAGFLLTAPRKGHDIFV